MTTRLHTAVTVDPAGLVAACAYCCTRPQLVALNRAYPGTVSHGMCAGCCATWHAEMDAIESAATSAGVA